MFLKISVVPETIGLGFREHTKMLSERCRIAGRSVDEKVDYQQFVEEKYQDDVDTEITILLIAVCYRM